MLIEALQWLGFLGRFDIRYGYLKYNSFGASRFRVKIPNHESFATLYFWTSYIYGNVQQELPTDMPTPRGKLM